MGHRGGGHFNAGHGVCQVGRGAPEEEEVLQFTEEQGQRGSFPSAPLRGREGAGKLAAGPETGDSGIATHALLAHTGR